MRHEEVARQSDRPELIRTPDQLQQTSRSDALRSSGTADQPLGTEEAVQESGILGQLQTERAHD
jgi:hypothetical protein